MRRGGRMGRGMTRPGAPIAPLMSVRSYVPPEMQRYDMDMEYMDREREMRAQQDIYRNQHMYNQQRQYEPDTPRYFDQVPYDSAGPSQSVRHFSRYYDDPVQEDYIPLNAGSMRPGAGSMRPGAGSMRPGAGSMRPAVGFMRAGAGSMRPGAGSMRPDVGTMRPGAGSMRPDAGSERPGAGWARASPEHYPRRGGVAQSFGSRLGPRPSPQSRPEPNASPRGRNRRPVTKYREPVDPVSATLNIPDIVSAGPRRPFRPNAEKYTLREDREPSTALNGLIELSVGHILKRLQHKYGTVKKYTRCLGQPFYTRRIKKVLRARIKQIILNKYVNDHIAITALYRKKFHERTDADFLNAIMKGDVKENPSEVAARTGMLCPNFYKRKMRHFIGAKLRQMFTDIQDMYNSPADADMDDHQACVTAQDGQFRNPKWKIDIDAKVDERLVFMLNNHMVDITTLLNLDPEYKRTKAALLAEALNMDNSISGAVVLTDLEGLDIKTALEEEPTAVFYYAKVQGLPDLPPRSLMRPFLDKFFPSTTKLHKIMKNLLYVTFCDKGYYNKFLAQDGVTIGGSKLKIQVSGKAKPLVEKDNDVVMVNADTDSQPSMNSTETTDNADLNISSDLGSKIDDLLSSIRRDEEEEASNGNTIDSEGNSEQNINNDSEPNDARNNEETTASSNDSVPVYEVNDNADINNTTRDNNVTDKEQKI